MIRYELQRDERLMHWHNPTWIERNGELIAAILGGAALIFAVGVGTVALVWSVVS